MPGIHQRLAAFEHEGDEAAVPAQEFSEQSALVTRCLLEYTAGQMSAVSCQKMCHAAVIDGCVHPEVWAVAAIGSWGEYPNNCNRDLKRFLGDVKSLPEPFIMKVPCVDTKSSPNITMFDELAMPDMQPVAPDWSQGDS